MQYNEDVKTGCVHEAPMPISAFAYIIKRTGSDSLYHLWHGDFTVLLKGVHHQAVAADVVDAL